MCLKKKINVILPVWSLPFVICLQRKKKDHKFLPNDDFIYYKRRRLKFWHEPHDSAFYDVFFQILKLGTQGLDVAAPKESFNFAWRFTFDLYGIPYTLIRPGGHPSNRQFCRKSV